MDAYDEIIKIALLVVQNPMTAILTMVLCWVFGNMLKKITKFPNDLIPIPLAFIGAVVLPLLAKSWTLEGAIVGLALGWISVGAYDAGHGLLKYVQSKTTKSD